MRHISKSSLLARSDCPFAWHCERDLGMEGKESIGFITGSAFHEVQRMLQEEKMKSKNAPTLKWAQDLCKVTFEGKLREAQKDGKLDVTEDQIANALKDCLGLIGAFQPYAEAISPVAVEREFDIALPGTEWSLYGFIDLICDSPLAGLHDVCDYKTVASSPYKEDEKDERGTEERRINYVTEVQWNLEVACYALGYRVLYGKTENEFVYWYAVKTKKPKVIPVRVKVTDAQIDYFLRCAVDMVKGIENGLHERRTNSNWCTPKGCPHWNFCHGIPERTPAASGQFMIV